MEPTYIRTGSTEEAEAYRKQSGEWTVASLQQSIGWTQKPITIDYAGRTFLLLPEDEQNLPAIATLGEHAVCRRAILEFASALAWSSGGSVAVESWAGGSQIYRTSKRPIVGQVTAQFFHIDYLPHPADPTHRLALALFHEGSTLIYVHVAYSFLSFYKIVNLVSGQRGPAQTGWINARVPAMNHHRAKERLAELQKAGEDIGKYVYQSCRCAIAHAGDPRNPVIDPTTSTTSAACARIYPSSSRWPKSQSRKWESRPRKAFIGSTAMNLVDSSSSSRLSLYKC